MNNKAGTVNPASKEVSKLVSSTDMSNKSVTVVHSTVLKRRIEITQFIPNASTNIVNKTNTIRPGISSGAKINASKVINSGTIQNRNINSTVNSSGIKQNNTVQIQQNTATKSSDSKVASTNTNVTSNKPCVKITEFQPPPSVSIKNDSKPSVGITTIKSSNSKPLVEDNAVKYVINSTTPSVKASQVVNPSTPRVNIVQCKVPTQIKYVNISLRLLTSRSIIIDVEPKYSDIDNIVKTFSTARFNGDAKLWTIEWDDHEEFVKKLKMIPGFRINFSNLPDFVIKMFATFKGKVDSSSKIDSTTKRTYKEEAERRIEASLLSKMFPYQKRGLEFGLRMHGRVYIADEMGLGKSLQGLAIARYYKTEWPLFIVCPAAVRYSWRDTFYTFLPDFERSKIFLIEKNSDCIPFDGNVNNVIIVSYAMLKKISTDIDKINGQLQELSLLQKLPKNAKELFCYPVLLHYLNRLNYIFAERYCDGKRDRFGYTANGSTNPDELKAILSTFFMIRRYKKDVLQDLPKKMRQVIYLRGELVEEEMKNIEKDKKLLDILRNKFEKNMSKGSEKSNTSVTEYFAKTGECKSKIAVKYIMEKYFGEDIEKRKVIIFAHHKTVLNKLQASCEDRGIKYIRIDGEVTGSNRDKAIKDFQNIPDVYVAILSITAAGAGVTLTAASTVIFAELHWNPGYLQQAEDRAHRIGQKDCVQIYYLIFSGTCDDFIFPMIQTKMKVLGELTLNNETFKDSEKKTEFMDRQKRITEFFSQLSSNDSDKIFDAKDEEFNEPNIKKVKLS